MASLSQCRALTGCRAFTVAKPRVKAQSADNGAKWFMKRKDSYMCEVQVGDEEPADTAVGRFMSQLVQTKILIELRNRRYKETPLLERKRKKMERIERRRNLREGIEEPTWVEFYGRDPEPQPFEDMFLEDDEEDFDVFQDMAPLEEEEGFLDPNLNPQFNQFGGYMTPAGTSNQWGTGGYLPSAGGGYMDSAPAAGARTAGYQSGYM